MPHQIITTLLDLIALFVLAVTASAALFPLLGLASVAAGGMVLFAGARLIDRLHDTDSDDRGGD